MLPKAQVSHHSVGRTRLRIPERKRDLAYLTATGRRLEVIPGVERAAVNAATGSILLEHHLSLQELSNLGRDRSLFEVEEVKPAEPASESLASNLRTFVNKSDERIRSLTDGEVDVKLLVAGGLMGLSLFQLRRGDFLPAGMVLALMAVDTLKGRF